MGRIISAFGRGIVLQALLLAIALAQFEVVEPEPFRGEEIADRSFSYNEQSFIDRFSYRFLPDLCRSWELYPEGYRSTIGSVSSDELYSVIQIRKRWLLDENLFASIRYRQDEDFDSAYQRLLVGAGFAWNEHLSLGVLADVAKRKEEIDLFFELEWQQLSLRPKENQPTKSDAGNRARLILVRPDHFYNGKSSEGYYKQKPQTLFGELVLAFKRDTVLQLWLNYNPQLQLDLYSRSRVYRYRKLSAGARLDLGISETLRLLIRARREVGSESQHELDSPVRLQELDRNNLIMETQLDYQVMPKLGGWIGVRYFGLEEDDLRGPQRVHPNSLDRAEFMGHLGVIWRINKQWGFAPGAYFNGVVIEQSQFPNLATDRKLVTSKFTFPLIYRFERLEGTLIMQPNLESPGGIFGGLNVQVQFRL